MDPYSPISVWCSTCGARQGHLCKSTITVRTLFTRPAGICGGIRSLASLNIPRRTKMGAKAQPQILRVTRKMLKGWGFCYDEERVNSLVGKRQSLRADKVLDLPISVEDKFFVLLREEVLGERNLQLFACDCAERVFHVFEKEFPNDKRPRIAIEIARCYIDSRATKKELDKARHTARSVAWEAAWDAIRYSDIEWQLKRLRYYICKTKSV